MQLINYVCVSVFLDDSEMFNDCVRMFLSDPETALTDTLPNGELGDTGRDQGHAAGELVRTLLAAEVFWKQGVDVYSAQDNRLLAMGEFYARYNLNYPTPFMPFGTKYSLYRILDPLPRPGNASTKIASMIYKAYAIRMGLSTPYSTQAMDANPFDADTFLYYKIADHTKSDSAAPHAGAGPDRAADRWPGQRRNRRRIAGWQRHLYRRNVDDSRRREGRDVETTVGQMGLASG